MEGERGFLESEKAVLTSHVSPTTRFPSLGRGFEVAPGKGVSMGNE